MKFGLVLVLLLFPFVANAQTPVSKDQANKYYSSCVEQSARTEKRFSKESQEMFCACTAARMTQFFSIEDMQTMTNTADPNARLALNKMIVNVYAPCMETPTRDYHYSTCVSNPQVGRLGGNKERLCGCAADKIAAHMKLRGAESFQEILNRNPNIEDPMQALYDDPKFQSFAQSQLLSCVSQ